MLTRFIESLHRFNPENACTPIQRDAERKLCEWGFHQERIAGLRAIVAEYSQGYFHCPEKALAMQEIQMWDSWRILLPDLSVVTSVRHSGDCRDIADSLAARLETDPIVADLSDIEIVLADGRSRTHFTQNQSPHVWVGLARKEGVVSRGSKMVVVDGAFQEISDIRTNGYKLHQASEPYKVTQKSPIVMPISNIEIFDDSIDVIDPANRILGLSQDRSVYFAMGFTSYKGQLRSFFQVGHENGQDAAIYMINPRSESVNFVFKRRPFRLSNSAYLELATMLEKTAQITVVR